MEFKIRLVKNTTKITAFWIDAVEKRWLALGRVKIKAKGIAPLTNPEAANIWY